MITRRTCLAAATLALAAPARAAPRLYMFEFYGEDDPFSRPAQQLKAQRVAVQGLMAPRLKVDSDFFIPSNTPVETCPFCASEADWIDGTIFLRMRRRQEAVDPGTPILVEGTLGIGPERDRETGFVRKIRPVEADFRKAGR